MNSGFGNGRFRLKSNAPEHLKRDRHLLIMLLPCLVFFIIFRYGPMYGLIIAFKNYDIYTGILKSPWVGFKYFQQFFSGYDFLVLFKNTFLLGIEILLWTTPFPIVFAILLNELRNVWFKKAVQTVSYLPSLLSVVIVSSLLIDFLSPTHGIVNHLLASLGMERIYFMIKPEWFRTVYIVSEIWQNMGFAAVIYFAAISNIDPTLYEAGNVDGCSRLRAIWHITVPSILPTIITMFILNSGNVMRIGFEKVLLLYNPMTYSVADVFSTYVYRKGLVEMNFSYSAAAGMFEALAAFAILVITNKTSRKLSDQSLW